MALKDIKKILEEKNQSPDDLKKQLEAAELGLQVAIEDIERVLAYAQSQKYTSAYLQALIDVLIPLRAMKSRLERGESTHPSSRVD